MNNCIGTVKIKEDTIITTKYDGEVSIWSRRGKNTLNYITYNGLTYYLTSNVESEDTELNDDYINQDIEL